MLERLALNAAKTLHGSLSEQRILKYGDAEKSFKSIHNRVKFLIILFLLIIFLVPISYIFNIKNELLLGCLTFFILRYWNNGHHFKSTDICFMVTFVAILSIPIINYFFGEYYFIYSIFSAISIIFFAPFRFQKSKNRFYFNKFVALAICIIGYFLGSVFAVAIFVQSIDLIHNPKNKRK